MSPHDRIALTGLMHSGKSTIRDVLVREGGYTHLAFADPVKDISTAATNTILFEAAKLMGNVDTEIMHREDIDADKQSYRLLHQHVGAFLRKRRGTEFWIDVLHYLHMVENPPPRIVIDDLRYLNESRYLFSMGFRVYCVGRPEDKRGSSVAADFAKTWGRVPTKEEMWQLMNHESETEVLDIPYSAWIDNSGTREELKEWVRNHLLS